MRYSIPQPQPGFSYDDLHRKVICHLLHAKEACFSRAGGVNISTGTSEVHQAGVRGTFVFTINRPSSMGLVHLITKVGDGTLVKA